MESENIADCTTDAIVHLTNNSYEISASILKKGGNEVSKIISDLHAKNNDLAECDVEISSASSNMRCKKIIHINIPSNGSADDLARVISTLL